MAPDEFQQAWQAQASQTRVTIDADLLRQEVRRDQQAFRTVILYRDYGEVAVALLLIPFWFILGAVTESPWTWYLTVPVLIWMAGFMLVYRRRHRQEPGEPDEPLLQCVQRSITEVEDQIWLLRNVFWWYLLPPSISILIFFAHVSWQSRAGGWVFALIFFLFLAGFLVGVYTWVYFLNQRAVRLQLIPKREELLTLQASLQEEGTGEGTQDQIALPGLPFSKQELSTSCHSPVRIILGLIGLFLIMLLAVFLIETARNSDDEPAHGQKSPFAAVRWQESQPEVKVQEEWYQLVSLNGISASEIVDFSKQTYDDKWQKRFEEDLVELLTRMGHPPEDRVTLEIQSLDSAEKKTLKEVPMTYENRRTIRNAAREREGSKP
ncbi:hypothetical protein [Gimesia maris]|uniref:Uncharacterized protein n=1 Tax=Gimesia maris TaxID=122 RepID=A0ABX5YSL8_9PLAN|nr:hypothetical protein [Gimesia maris]EDL61879.1 hypothetical protein PM8797T_21508 [Gimesia maris DSM 8797]QEG18562.1 hypothetical protein GmarT_44520 [Gimesia maris]QGQ28478.1 hypothetical protein F1729_07360 [Gimesia maris]